MYLTYLVVSLPEPNQTVTVTYLFCYHDSYLLCKKANAERSTCQTQRSLKELKVICTQIVEALVRKQVRSETDCFCVTCVRKHIPVIFYIKPTFSVGAALRTGGQNLPFSYFPVSAPQKRSVVPPPLGTEPLSLIRRLHCGRKGRATR